ncbi:DNA mismatch endonuclease Vsr [Aceticella autotrophica]|uniref:Very short patch repair endonuclease n=1 Tax=Aceticella autotrophica TaxID=2755338 RepID=A0A975AW80_9THEO|nr:very short patch repair endonuclease [Aceticella autotrophica]QSZ27620.1 DNA mismatch endonuclease Vsr [Aceticella autotrophica]
MDNHSKEIRSYNMSQIKSKDNKLELLVRKYLFSKGFRYRKNAKNLPGSPDIVLPKYKTVIFINGCFWHMHEGCQYSVKPKSNEEYWSEKLLRNKERDNKNQELLRRMGWNVIIVWECELKRDKKDIRLNMLYNQIKEGVIKNNY